MGAAFYAKGHKRVLLTVTAWALLIAVTGCSSVIFTGRSRPLLFSQEQVTQMADEAYEELIATENLVTSGPVVQRVRQVGTNVACAAESVLREMGMKEQLKYFDWEFSVIKNDDLVNALALPGGKVVVFTGLMKVVQNNDELAVVLAHEVAHVIAQHGNERMSQQLLLQAGGVVLEEATETTNPQTRRLFRAIYGLGATVGVLLPYSRTHETEADKIGLIIAAQAGYDPAAAIPLWENMKKQQEETPPEFLSTHPAPDTRIEDIKDYLPEARKYAREHPSPNIECIPGKG